MADGMKELYRSDTTVVATCNNILMTFAVGKPTRRDMQAVERCGAELSARWPAGIAYLLATAAGTRPPDQEQRDAMIAVFKRLSPHIRAMACVVLGEGFMAAAVRGALSALSLAVRTGFPTKVSSDMEPAVAWLSSEMSGRDGASFNTMALSDRARALLASVPPPRARAL